MSIVKTFSVRFTFLVVVASFLSTVAFADGESDNNSANIELTGIGKSKAKLSLDNLEGKKVAVKIKDLEGNTLYAKFFKNKEQYNVLYDLGSLEKGTYKVEVFVAGKQIEKLLDVNDGRLAISASGQNDGENYSGHVYFQNNKLKVFIKNNNRHDLGVQLYDINNNLVYFEEIQDEDKILKVYNLTKLKNGAYSYVVNLGDKTFTETFEISK
ncbi:hypothetical protein AAG747_14715 [Rapidithrix thailandica]|uniref:Por secretion system C-terminal sorting domain-containing protein n=1 Tax=Rapidithrix thailandica TaxID=413964 RepID=A0AAW9S5N7_9BACT